MLIKFNREYRCAEDGIHITVHPKGSTAEVSDKVANWALYDKAGEVVTQEGEKVVDIEEEIIEEIEEVPTGDKAGEVAPQNKALRPVKAKK